ncbi:MAG: hypothetical protein AAF798_07975, partial [Bacteroidota bacterium]
YRIKGNKIIEKRALQASNYPSYSKPKIGKQLIFRLLNFDTTIFLEFQPTMEGGTPYRVDIRDLGVDEVTLPLNHVFGNLNTGNFDNQNNFLFVGLDYPSWQQFFVELKIDYNAASNTIETVEIQDRIDITPMPSMQDYVSEVSGVIGVEDVSFITTRSGGTYRFQNGTLQYLENLHLMSIIVDQQDYYGTILNGGTHIAKSTDAGFTWGRTGAPLPRGGRLLYKKGEYFIATHSTGPVFNVSAILSVGKSLETMEPFRFYPSSRDFINARVEFYDGNYFLITDDQIFVRSQMN